MVTETSVIPPLPGWHGVARLHRYFVCDVFTEGPLEGNQLGVFVDGRPFSTEDMQRLARELNVAETVFLFPPREGGDVHMRIFTPHVELPFAGHPVLGTAFVVAAALERDEVTLETEAGLVPIRLEREGDEIRFGRMQQPVPPWEPFAQKEQLLAALGLETSRLPVELYRNGPPHVYVALESEEAVAGLTPDFTALKELNIAANCFAGSGSSWKTRMFYPAAGIQEDPATGSAAGPLAVHLARHGLIDYGQEIEIRQGAEIGRPSVLHAVARGSGDRVDAVEVSGAAVIVAEGLFRVVQ